MSPTAVGVAATSSMEVRVRSHAVNSAVKITSRRVAMPMPAAQGSSVTASLSAGGMRGLGMNGKVQAGKGESVLWGACLVGWDGST